VVRVRPEVVVSARATGEPAGPAHRGRRAAQLTAAYDFGRGSPTASSAARPRPRIPRPAAVRGDLDGRHWPGSAPGGDLVPPRPRRPGAGELAEPAALAAGAGAGTPGVPGLSGPRRPDALGRPGHRGRGGRQRGRAGTR